MNFSPDLLDNDKPKSLKCETCGGWRVLDFACFVRVIEGIEVAIENLPVLLCKTCDVACLPPRSRDAIFYHVHEAKKINKASIIFARKPGAKSDRFAYCEKIGFLYDPADCRYLPGLYRSDGFLTPVFFNKTVLLKYMSHPEYVLELVSDTYGSIWRNGEHILSFGINCGGKVIVWLGDLAKLPEEEQHYLRSENVPSDHDIGSEFYLGQIEAEFTDYSKERKLFHLRSEFGAKCLNDYSLKVNLYDMEVLALMGEVIRPVAWSDKEVRGTIEALNKILVESLNAKGLRENIISLKPDEDVKSLGGMKLLQRWLDLAYPSINGATALSPFFVLYDFRIVVAHLVPADSAAKTLTFCYERMGVIEGSRTYESLYDTLVDRLAQSYQDMLAAPKPTA